jgi:hypothetical protein
MNYFIIATTETNTRIHQDLISHEDVLPLGNASRQDLTTTSLGAETEEPTSTLQE